MAKVAKLQREPLTRRAVQAIRDAIFGGEYAPGQRMVEEEVAKTLGVSRNVVREAFWQLEAQGLLQSDDYKGKSVVLLQVADIVELIPLRLSLESLASAWAARNITPEAAAELRLQWEQFLRLEHGEFSYSEVDFELHQMIWRLSGNRQIALMLDRIAAPMIALQARIFQSHIDFLVQKEQQHRAGSHAEVVDAICAADSERARRAIQQHILDFWTMWLEQASEVALPGSWMKSTIDDALSVVNSLAGVLDRSFHPPLQ